MFRYCFSNLLQRINLVTVATAITLASLSTAQMSYSEDNTKKTPQIYKWIDQNGISHYTTDVERIPKVLRRQLKRGGSPPEGSEETEETKIGFNEKMAPRKSGFSQNARLTPSEKGPTESGQTFVDQERINVLDAEISALQETITTDEEALKSLISRSEGKEIDQAEHLATLRELGERLPGSLKLLETLRAERAAISAD